MVFYWTKKGDKYVIVVSDRKPRGWRHVLEVRKEGRGCKMYEMHKVRVRVPNYPWSISSTRRTVVWRQEVDLYFFINKVLPTWLKYKNITPKEQREILDWLCKCCHLCVGKKP